MCLGFEWRNLRGQESLLLEKKRILGVGKKPSLFIRPLMYATDLFNGDPSDSILLLELSNQWIHSAAAAGTGRLAWFVEEMLMEAGCVFWGESILCYVREKDCPDMHFCLDGSHSNFNPANVHS